MIIINNPFFWAFLFSIFLGAAINRLTKKKSKTKGNKKLKIFFFIYFCFAIIFLIFAIIFPGIKKILTLKVLYFSIITLVISFLFFRYKRSFGIPLIVIIVLLIIILILFVQSLVNYTGEIEIGKVEIKSFKNRIIDMEILRPGENPENVKLWGDTFAPIVQTVIFDDIYVFLGSKTKYRFLGFTSFVIKKENGLVQYKQANTDYYFVKPQGISNKLFNWFEKNEELIPGIKTTQVEISIKKPKPLKEYSLLLQNDGGVQIVEVRK